MTNIAHISDFHFGRFNPAAAEALVADLHEQRPDLLVLSGDLTQRARPGQYAAARALIDRLPIPQIIVPGNHDVPLWNVYLRALDPFGRFRRYITTDEFPEFEHDDVHVVGINTASRLAPRLGGFWKDGKLRAHHLARLREIFAEETGPRAKVRILVAHHPFIEPEGGHGHGIIHGAASGLKVLEALEIDLILGGHLHISYRGDVRAQHPHIRRPIINLMAGSATSTRRREPFNAYNLIRVDEGRIEISIRQYIRNAWRSAQEST